MHSYDARHHGCDAREWQVDVINVQSNPVSRSMPYPDEQFVPAVSYHPAHRQGCGQDRDVTHNHAIRQIVPGDAEHDAPVPYTHPHFKQGICCGIHSRQLVTGRPQVGIDVIAALDNDVVPDGSTVGYTVPSTRYAVALGEGFQQVQHLSPRPSRCMSPRKLRKENGRLKSQNKRLCCMLSLLIVLFTATLTPLFLKHPYTKGDMQRFFSPASSFSGTPSHAASSSSRRDSPRSVSSAPNSAGPCRSVSEHFQDVIGKCSPDPGSADGRLCHLDVKTAMCILTETKSDMFNTTRSLVKNVAEIKQNLSQIDAIASGNAVSAVYDIRPTIHFDLKPVTYQKSTDQSQVGCLQWRIDTSMPPERDMEIVSRAGEPVVGNCYDVKVTQEGFYYVYSQVSSEGNGGGHKHHYVIKNYSRSETQQKLLGVEYSRTGDQHTSYLQGVFRLQQNETVSVLSDMDELDKLKTFFGMFRI